MMTSRYNRYHAILLIGCLVFCLVALFPHTIRPKESSRIYAPLIGVLIVSNIIALVIVRRSPSVATQQYWWSALVVIGAMTFFFQRTSETRGLPVIVAIPTLATVILRILISLRAAIIYGIGVLAFLLPAGVAFDDLGRSISYVAATGLLVIICGIVLDRQNIEYSALTELCIALEQKVSDVECAGE